MFGIPRVVKSDNGSPFPSYEFKQYAENMGLYHRRITTRWPRANAQAECFNKHLMKSICSAHINQRNWKQEMFKFLRQYHATPHTSTRLTPYALLFNRNPSTKLPMIPIITENTSLDEYVHNRDSEAKYKIKTSANMKKACSKSRHQFR